MEKKIAALSSSILILEDLQKSIRTETLDPPQALAAKFNNFAGSLGELFEAGRDMDQSSLMEIPLDMLAFLDGEISNPELYYHTAVEIAEGNAQKLQNRIHYVEGISGFVQQATRGGTGESATDGSSGSGSGSGNSSSSSSGGSTNSDSGGGSGGGSSA